MKKVWLMALALFMLTGSQLFATVPSTSKPYIADLGSEKIEFNFLSNKDKPWFGESKSARAVAFSRSLDLNITGKKALVSSLTLDKMMVKMLAYKIDGEYEPDGEFDVTITVDAYALLVDDKWIKTNNPIDNSGMKNATNVNITPGMTGASAGAANGVAAATILLQVFAPATQMIYKIDVINKNNETETFFAQVGGNMDSHGLFLGKGLNLELNR